jgi:cytochrome c-type biogenesis protein CcmF
VDGVFRADQVLAKHDENYMPPEAAAALKNAAAGPNGMAGSQTMIYELGPFRLILALAMALVQACCRWRAHRPATAPRGWPGPAGGARAVPVRGDCLCLPDARLRHNDFSVRWRPTTPTPTLPLVYRITAVWGNHEGSILLWSLILAGWTLAVSFFSRQLDDPWWRACWA